ncbi:MAG: PASTA domain-containing protein [Actinomycetota bacterium]
MRRMWAAAVALAAIAVIAVIGVVSGGSNEPVKVPDVVGRPYEEAAAMLKASGFRVERVDQTCIKNFALFPEKSRVVSRIRRGGTGVQGGFDTAPRGAKLALDIGIEPGSVECLVPDGRIDTNTIVGLLWLGGASILGVLAGRDMRRRGERGGVWGIIVFLTFPFGVLLWLVVRADKPVIPGAAEQMRRDAEAFSPFESSDRG